MASALKRIELRCTEEQREIIDRAVDLSGRSMTDFLLDAAQDAAMKTIREFEAVKVSVRDSAALAQALLNPQGPNAALRAAARRYKAATE